MSPEVTVAIIAAVPPTIAAGVAAVIAFRAHRSTNSRMTELLEATRLLATHKERQRVARRSAPRKK